MDPSLLRRIGIYGGTFDPVHHGHLMLAQTAAELLFLDRVFLLPAARNPFKETDQSTPGELRLRMLEAAVAGSATLEADGRELLRPPPSFTVDTVIEFHAEYPSAEIHLFIGGDQLHSLRRWKDFQALNAMVRWVVFDRGQSEGETPDGACCIGRRFDISATEIRDRVAKGLSVRYLVPRNVRQIIEAENLYRSDAG